MNALQREETIRDLFPAVRQIARRVMRVARAADIDDLVGDGSIGLIRAVDTFDPRRGTTLDVYARKLIVGAMLNGMRRLDPVSERVRRTLRRAEEERYALAQDRGSLPSFVELELQRPGLRRARVAAFRQAPLSIDAPLQNAIDPLADWRGEPSALAASGARRREVADAVATLPARQRHIVALHYGAELSLHAIGSKLCVSPQRVSQLHLSALSRLRAVLPGA